MGKIVGRDSPKEMRPLFSIDSLIWLGIEARLWPGLRCRFLGGFSGALGALLLLWWWWCFLCECEWEPAAVEVAPVRSEPTLLKRTTPPPVDCVRSDDIFCKNNWETKGQRVYENLNVNVNTGCSCCRGKNHNKRWFVFLVSQGK